MKTNYILRLAAAAALCIGSAGAFGTCSFRYGFSLAVWHA